MHLRSDDVQVPIAVHIANLQAVGVVDHRLHHVFNPRAREKLPRLLKPGEPVRTLGRGEQDVPSTVAVHIAGCDLDVAVRPGVCIHVFHPLACHQIGRCLVPLRGNDHVQATVLVHIDEAKALPGGAGKDSLGEVERILLTPDHERCTRSLLVARHEVQVAVEVKIADLDVVGARRSDDVNRPDRLGGVPTTIISMVGRYRIPAVIEEMVLDPPHPLSVPLRDHDVQITIAIDVDDLRVGAPSSEVQQFAATEEVLAPVRSGVPRQLSPWNCCSPRRGRADRRC